MFFSTPAEKTTLSACRARHVAQIAPKSRPQSPDGLLASTPLACWLRVCTQRDMGKNRQNITAMRRTKTINCIYHRDSLDTRYHATADYHLEKQVTRGGCLRESVLHLQVSASRSEVEQRVTAEARVSRAVVRSVRPCLQQPEKNACSEQIKTCLSGCGERIKNSVRSNRKNKHCWV